MNDEEKLQFERDLYDASYANAVKGKEALPPVKLRCLGCNGELWFPADSREATGEFNPFCPNGECEDRYAARL